MSRYYLHVQDCNVLESGKHKRHHWSGADESLESSNVGP